MTKTALITGITGQDGSYLAELLLTKGYTVYGLTRRSSSNNVSRIAHLMEKITLLEGDMADHASLNTIFKTALPDEVYNLAAQSFVATSWNQPVYTGDITGLGVVRLLESLKEHSPDARFYQASSSEMYGVSPPPQNEETPLHPRSPYAVAKVYGYYATINYRESYGIFACNGVLFNHESPRRGIEFVTRKITDGVARIVTGKQNDLALGNLDAKRDWGFAGDYVEAMYKILQHGHPDDYVIATNESHSVKEFVDRAFSSVDLDWTDYVKTDTRFMRPADVPELRGDYSKAKHEIGWKPTVTFPSLVDMMVSEDIRRIEDGSA